MCQSRERISIPKKRAFSIPYFRKLQPLVFEEG